MKAFVRLSLLLAMALAVGAASAQTSIKMTWANPTTSWTPCSSTVTVACIDHSILTDVTVSSAPVILSAAITPSTVTYTTPIPAGNAYATRLYTLISVYKDVSGANQMTSAATCGSSNSAPPCAVASIPVTPPPSATNFQGVVQ